MKVFTIVHGSFLFIVTLRFDAIALNLKPSTSNIKLSTSNSKKEDVALCGFCLMRYPLFARSACTNIHILYYHPLSGYGTERP